MAWFLFVLLFLMLNRVQKSVLSLFHLEFHCITDKYLQHLQSYLEPLTSHIQFILSPLCISHLFSFICYFFSVELQHETLKLIYILCFHDTLICVVDSDETCQQQHKGRNKQKVRLNLIKNPVFCQSRRR